MFHHIAWAMKAPTPDALSRWLLVVLADHANEDGKCWPSQATLARRTGMGRSTVNRKLAMLEKQNLISRISGNHERSTMYHLVVPQQDKLEPERDKLVPQQDTKLPVNNNTLPDDWKPSDELIASIDDVAHRNGQEVNHDIETNKFIAYNEGKQMRNIPAAYRKWCYNAVTFAVRDGGRKDARQQHNSSKQNDHGRRWREFIGSVGV